MLKTNLFFNYYNAGDRQHEIDKCLDMNIKVFDEVIVIDDRPTFSELFALTKQFPNDINCFCNSDCYFEDISLLQKIKDNECYALTRTDMLGTKYASCSQDAWCFKGEVKNIEMPYTQGLWGIDNRLAAEITNAGYTLKNPSLSIKLIHLHSVDKRDQVRTAQNTVPPPYILIAPTV